MNKPHPATLSYDELLKDCEIKKTRRGGPGGQHRNKVESAIVITHLPTQVMGQAGERRSQHANRKVAIERLRINLALAVRIETGLGQSPSELWQSRVKSQKISISPDHRDFAALLAEACHFLTAEKFEIPVTAKRLNVSNSQLVKFFKLNTEAFQFLNQSRAALGLKPLK